jgi:hypothetical protein
MRGLACVALTLLACNNQPVMGTIAIGPPPKWSTFTDMPLQQPRWGMPLTLVPSERRFIGFGGTSYPDGGAVAETWSLSMRDQSWTRVLETGAPPPRYGHCTAYLPEQNQVLLVGGRDDSGALPPAAWTLDVATRDWEPVTDGDLPQGVLGCHAVWMASIGRAVVFGGGSDSGVVNGTWLYDAGNRRFAAISPTTSPPGRMDGAFAYDPGDGGRALLFGGMSESHLDDLWIFDGTNWSPADVASPPPGRRVPAAGFDAERRLWLVFGGTIETEDLADLWQLDAASLVWTRLDVDGAPPARGFTSAGWEPIAGALVVAGGLDQPGLNAFADGWLLGRR